VCLASETFPGLSGARALAARFKLTEATIVHWLILSIGISIANSHAMQNATVQVTSSARRALVSSNTSPPHQGQAAR